MRDRTFGRAAIEEPTDAFGQPMNPTVALQPVNKGELARLARLRKDATDTAIRKLMMILAVLVVVTLAAAAIGLVAKDTATSNNAKRINEIAKTRQNSILVSCRESNEHHDAEVAQRERRHRQARAFIDRLVAATPGPKPAPGSAAAKAQARQVALFLEAIAPRSGPVPTPLYAAGKGTLAQREAAGCKARLTKLSRP